MKGLPGPLLKELKQTLLECGPFENDRALRGVFADERIAPWKNQVAGANYPQERVDLFVNDFLNRRNIAGQNVLVLFLQALHDQSIEEDACHQRLNDVAIKVAAATGSTLPPLARGNLWRASTVRVGETLPSDLAGYAPLPFEPDRSALLAPLPPNLPTSAFAERLESLKKKEADWLPLDFLEKGLQAARTVGRVDYQGNKIGTAFLVAADLVLTNAHVVADIPAFEQGKVRFHVGKPTEQVYYFAKQIAQSSMDELDFALVQLQSPVADVQPVTLSTEGAWVDQPANILQYPAVAGGGMQVALRHNLIVHVDSTRLYYVADTAGGSSGSPVFNDEWRVIALHRAGMVDDAHRPVKYANQGVPLKAIEPLIRPYLQNQTG
ncbi:MAG TPA: serine protease [Anaerolineae bacterium]|nr:serine protease [Anaerolineae bacterium]HQH39816.1 serine protease [Anaerolineae bacterium]